MVINQEVRHRSALILAWGAWLGAFGLLMARVAEVIKPETRAASFTGLIIVFLIGVAIAAGMTLSRMRLAATMTEAFRAGLAAQRRRDQAEDIPPPRTKGETK